MRRIRIGKDVTVRYPVLTGGEPVSLAGRKLRLVLTDPLGNERAMPFHTYGNVVVFTFPASHQRVLGVYKITLIEELEDGATTIVDCEDAFMLVKTTAQECGHGCGGGNLEVGVRGLSTYEIWLSRGYEGTPDDFLDWVREPATEAADTIGNRYKIAIEGYDEDGAATFADTAEEMAETIKTALSQEATVYVCSTEVGAPAAISTTQIGYSFYFIGADGRRHGIDLAVSSVAEDDGTETVVWTIYRQRVWTVDEIEAALAMSDRVTEVESDMQALKSDMQTLTTDVEEAKTDVEAVKSDVDTLTTTVEAVKTDMQTVKTDVEAVKTDVDTLTTTVDTLTNTVEEVKTDVDTLTNTVEAVESDVAAVKSDVETLTTTVEAVKTDVDTLKTTVEEAVEKMITAEDWTDTTDYKDL